VINDRERAAVLRLEPSANVQVVSNGIDVPHFASRQTAAPSANVVFTGVFNYQPNEDGAVWMAQRVWPFVRSRRPDARLLFVGASPTRQIRRLAAADSTIDVTGTVADVRPHLWNAAVAVVPLSTARGLQNKALEAIAAGVPVVITPCVRDGLPASVAAACAVAEEPRRFADAVLELLARSPDDRRQLAARADLSALSWSSQLQPLLQLLDSVGRRAHARTA
jgi:glycosyltransferase involved in cell wall biosynthesis